MMRRLVTPALLCAVILATPAAAEDPRLVEKLYNPGEVVRIDSRPRVQATIIFGDNELIENVAIGDSETWQVTPNKRANLLFVKPLKDRASTNMTVVTSKNTYLFDLVSTPSGKPMYVLRFTYPPTPESQKQKEMMAAGPSADELAAASNPAAIGNPGELNFSWKTEGDRKLIPDRAYDDGESTFLTWSSGNPVPAILVQNEEGLEGPVNYTVRGETVVVDGVPRQIILRSGRKKAILTFQGTDRSSASRDSALARAGENN